MKLTMAFLSIYGFIEGIAKVPKKTIKRSKKSASIWRFSTSEGARVHDLAVTK